MKYNTTGETRQDLFARDVRIVVARLEELFGEYPASEDLVGIYRDMETHAVEAIYVTIPPYEIILRFTDERLGTLGFGRSGDYSGQWVEETGSVSVLADRMHDLLRPFLAEPFLDFSRRFAQSIEEGLNKRNQP